MHSASEREAPLEQARDPEAFWAAIRARSARAAQRGAQGTALLRDELFPTLDNIMDASPQELDDLLEFAGKLMSGPVADPGLNYRIHLALVSYARQKKLRDMLIRELYHLGMALYNLETSLSPSPVRLYAVRMRMCFAEAASHFETDYDEIQDPEIRGFIHRSMSNIALGYEGNEPEIARAKLTAITRAIRILSDPDVRAKTPSLPWELYLYKSHQERTSMLSYLRTGNAEADVFAQVLESAQVVHQRQARAAREQGVPLQPRWQYAYIAARYHCGAMLLPDFLDGLYALSTAQPEDDFSYQGLFSHISIPALFMEYGKEFKNERERRKLAPRLRRMLNRMFPWLMRLSSSGSDASFALRQLLYAYVELPDCMPFFEAAQNVFAAARPDSYARMWITGQVSRLLCDWMIRDYPERLIGLSGCTSAEDVAHRREELLDFATRAGRLCDIGVVHFFGIDETSCRGRFEEEQALLQLHAYCGSQLLGSHDSTALCADVAYGHHCHYDERGGYPLGFSPRTSPVRPMIYLVAAASALAAAVEDFDARFDGIVAELFEGEGTRFSPFVVRLLRAPGRVEQLRECMELWVRQAYVDLLDRRKAMLAAEGDSSPA